MQKKHSCGHAATKPKPLGVTLAEWTELQSARLCDQCEREKTGAPEPLRPFSGPNAAQATKIRESLIQSIRAKRAALLAGKFSEITSEDLDALIRTARARVIPKFWIQRSGWTLEDWIQDAKPKAEFFVQGY